MYTQRGRLTQDDAARELRKQSAVGSPDTWQPVNTKTGRRLAPAGDAARETDTSAEDETVVETSPVAPRAASRVTTRTARNAAPAKAKAKVNAKGKTAKAKTASARKSKRTTRAAKTGNAMTAAQTRTKTKPTPTRKAVLVRNGAGAAHRATTKRRRS